MTRMPIRSVNNIHPSGARPELGRQPWTVYGQLPTWLSASTHSVGYMIFSLTGFVLLYSLFIVVEMYLMVKFIRLGPSEGKHDAHADSVRQQHSSQWSEA